MLYLVLFLIVVAVGGLGSLKGTLLAALVVGIVDTGGKYMLAEAGGFFIYAIAVAILAEHHDGVAQRHAEAAERHDRLAERLQAGKPRHVPG